MFTPDTLADKSILVTGGGSGLGFAMAEKFAALGARVAICGRKLDRLTEAGDRIKKATGKAVACFACDVREYDAVQKMFQEIESSIGVLNGLVNNAAGNFYCFSEDLTPNGFRSVVDIVLNGTFNCTQIFGKALIAAKKPGSILNIVTTYATNGSAFVLPSACSKAGVLALTASLGFEWADHGIRVNAVAPGPIPTEGAWARLMPDKSIEELYRKTIPTRRFGKPDELANLAAFLISDLAPYITGECIAIDGAEQRRSGSFNFLQEYFPREKLREAFAAIRPGKNKS